MHCIEPVYVARRQTVSALAARRDSRAARARRQHGLLTTAAVADMLRAGLWLGASESKDPVDGTAAAIEALLACINTTLSPSHDPNQLVAAAIKDVLNARGDVARMSVALTTMSQAL